MYPLHFERSGDFGIQENKKESKDLERGLALVLTPSRPLRWSDDSDVRCAIQHLFGRCCICATCPLSQRERGPAKADKKGRSRDRPSRYEAVVVLSGTCS